MMSAGAPERNWLKGILQERILRKRLRIRMGIAFIVGVKEN